MSLVDGCCLGEKQITLWRQKDGRDKEEGTRHKVSFAQAETGNPSTSFVSHLIFTETDPSKILGISKVSGKSTQYTVCPVYGAVVTCQIR